VTHLSFSSVVDDDQYYIISACKDNNPMLRDGITGDWIGTFIGHKGAVWQARISSDATLAATGSADFTAKVWDTHTGETLHTLQHRHIVRAVAFPSQPRPAVLATGGKEKILRIFDLSRSTPASPNGPSNGLSNGAHEAEAAPAPSYEIGPGTHGDTIKSIVWGTDPNILVTAADDKKIRWWDLRMRAAVSEFEVEGLIGSCELNGLAHDASKGVLSVAAGKSVYFFDGLASRRLLKTVKTDQEVASVALHAESRRFVTGGTSDTWVRVYDYDQGTELGTSFPPHQLTLLDTDDALSCAFL
jgi:serine-threonine kinase receptor-associated protein